MQALQLSCVGVTSCLFCVTARTICRQAGHQALKDARNDVIQTNLTSAVFNLSPRLRSGARALSPPPSLARSAPTDLFCSQLFSCDQTAAERDSACDCQVLSSKLYSSWVRVTFCVYFVAALAVCFIGPAGLSRHMQSERPQTL